MWSISFEVLVAFGWWSSLAETCKGLILLLKHCCTWWNSILILLINFRLLISFFEVEIYNLKSSQMRMIVSEVRNNIIQITILLYFNEIFLWSTYFHFVERHLGNNDRRYGGRLRDLDSIPGRLWGPPSLGDSFPGGKAAGTWKIFLEGQGKLRIISVRIVCVPTEIWSAHLAKTIQKLVTWN
jgi:hypothetical protein